MNKLQKLKTLHPGEVVVVKRNPFFETGKFVRLIQKSDDPSLVDDENNYSVVVRLFSDPDGVECVAVNSVYPGPYFNYSLYEVDDDWGPLNGVYMHIDNWLIRDDYKVMCLFSTYSKYFRPLPQNNELL